MRCLNINIYTTEIINYKLIFTLKIFISQENQKKYFKKLFTQEQTNTILKLFL